MKVLIDTDCGVDDAAAILFALQCERCQVVAVTCCHGNATLDCVCYNVARVLDTAGRSDVPVYRGCDRPLVPPPGHREVPRWPGHGADGLGDCGLGLGGPAPRDPQPLTPVPTSEGEHAAVAICRIVKRCAEEGEKVHVVTLGPLTNVALAVAMRPEIAGLVERVAIMGGSHSCKGNSSFGAEFNFHMDPEAARIVVDRFARVDIVPFDNIITVPWPAWDGIVSSSQAPAAKLMARATAKLRVLAGDSSDGVLLCDAIAMAAFLDPQTILEEQKLAAEVETAGEHSRGALILDWYGAAPEEKRNVRIVMRMDAARYTDILRAVLMGAKWN
eukprot:m51a1_g9604 purine nucleosidase, putative (330) ;mRNA; f:1055351-1056621